MERGPTEFAEFYESTRDDCLRIVLLNVGDRHLADELVAEAYARAWISWRKVRELEVPRAWVVRTALNAHVSWWRRRRHVMAGTALAVTTLAPSGQSSSPSGRVASHAPAVRLAAWTVTRQANGDIKVTVRQLSDPSGLQSTLRADGVPANVTVLGHPDPSCQPYPMSQALFASVYGAEKTAASGDTVLIIDPSALPSGAGVQIGAAVGPDAGGRGVHRADVNQAIHHAVHQPAAHQVGAHNGVLRAVLVYTSQQISA